MLILCRYHFEVKFSVRGNRFTMNLMDFDHKCGADDSLKYFQKMFLGKNTQT